MRLQSTDSDSTESLALIRFTFRTRLKSSKLLTASFGTDTEKHPMEWFRNNYLLHFKNQDPIFFFRKPKYSIRDWRKYCCHQPYNNAKNHLNSPDCHSNMSMLHFLPLVMLEYLQRFLGVLTSCFSTEKYNKFYLSVQLLHLAFVQKPCRFNLKIPWEHTTYSAE